MNVQPAATKELKASVVEVVDAALKRGNEVIDRHSVAAEILDAHPIKYFRDAAWYVGWAAMGIGDLLMTYVRSLKAEESEQQRTGQMTLTGFERLQSHYAIKRNGDLCVVPLVQLTKLEWARKVKEHRMMAQGHELHAQELEDWGNPKFGELPPDEEIAEEPEPQFDA